MLADDPRQPGAGSIELTLVDDRAIAFATFQSHNQKVVSNSRAIFITHVRSANENYTAQKWRLSRSTDAGRSFETLLEATAATSAPVLELDESANLYAARPDFLDGNAYLHVFRPPGYRDQPSVSPIPGAAAGKYAMLLDENRRQLYFLAHNNEFRVIGVDGRIRHSTTLLRNGPNAALQYPHLALARDGTLAAAWTTSAPAGYLYWDIHCMLSRDGGVSWQRLDGTPLTLPVIADDTGPTDRISLDDEFRVHSWLSSLLAKQGKLHFVYWADTKPPRQRYVRYDLTTGAKDVERQPMFARPEMTLPNDSGLLATAAGRESSPLYFVSTINDRRRLACLVSDDNGRSWLEFAISKRVFPHRVYSIGGARELAADGSVIGTFTNVVKPDGNYTEPESGEVYFFKISDNRSFR